MAGSTQRPQLPILRHGNRGRRCSIHRPAITGDDFIGSNLRANAAIVLTGWLAMKIQHKLFQVLRILNVGTSKFCKYPILLSNFLPINDTLLLITWLKLIFIINPFGSITMGGRASTHTTLVMIGVRQGGLQIICPNLLSMLVPFCPRAGVLLFVPT